MYFIHCTNFNSTLSIHPSIFQTSFPSQYSLLPHYTHFHQRFIITFTISKKIYASIFELIFILPSPNIFQQLSTCLSYQSYPNCQYFLLLPTHSFHQLQRTTTTTTTTTKTTCQQRQLTAERQLAAADTVSPDNTPPERVQVTLGTSERAR